MKSKKLTKKLMLRKSTVAVLDHLQQIAVKGGYWETAMFTGCYTWHPEAGCFTQPAYRCFTILEETDICP
jgi:hypothetical protein